VVTQLEQTQGCALSGVRDDIEDQAHLNAILVEAHGIASTFLAGVRE
jgi:hypothetical protein